VKVVVGLGNPGARYAATRHNVGFRVVEALAASHRISLRRSGEQAAVGRGMLAGDELWVAQPLDHMNRSGLAVHRLLAEAGADAGSLLVVYDDLDLPLGQLRFKRQGGPGGHNGVRSIIEALGTDRFLRLKVGIGRPPSGCDPVEYVLEPFSPEETAVIGPAVARAGEAIDVALAEGVEAAMNRFHAS
jgi:PTH1 family peptidyl-tRNA hydrolase